MWSQLSKLPASHGPPPFERRALLRPRKDNDVRLASTALVGGEARPVRIFLILPHLRLAAPDSLRAWRATVPWACGALQPGHLKADISGG